MTKSALAAVLALSLCCPLWAGDGSSLYQQELRTPTPLAAAPAVAVGAGGAPAAYASEPYAAPAASLIAPAKARPRTYAKHQLVTIVIREQASQSTKGDAQSSRDSSIDGGVDEWVNFKFTHQFIQPANLAEGKPGVKADIKREFDGSGSASRSDSLTARIQAEIIDIKPNGNLVLQASKMVKTDEESYTITATGVCRSQDILPDNTVLSTQIAELKVVKESTGGLVKDAVKRGWIHRLFDWANLF